MEQGRSRLGGVAVATAVTLALSACSAPDGARLRPNAPEAGDLTSIFRLNPGDVFSEGMVQVFPEGDEAIEIVGVHSNDMDGDLEYLGAYVAGVDREVNNQIVRTYPPEGSGVGFVEPAQGARLGPVPEEKSEAGIQVLLGYRVGEQARSSRGSVSIEYRVGDGPVRTQEEAVAMVVCTSVIPDDEHCSDPDD